MANAPFNQFVASSPSEGIQDGSPPVVAPSQEPAGTPGQAGQTTQGTPESWRLPGLEKFRTSEDLARAYLESQRTMSQGQSKLKEYETAWGKVSPYLPYLSWIDQALAEQEAAENAGAGRGNQRQPKVDPSITRAFEELREGQKQLTERQQKFVISNASRTFAVDHPEAKQYADEINAMIEDENSPIAIKDFSDPQQVYRALETAYRLVAASKEQKKAAGGAAARVAGGSMGQTPKGFDPYDPKVSAADILGQIHQEMGQQ